jgi:hypothetical protein
MLFRADGLGQVVQEGQAPYDYGWFNGPDTLQGASESMKDNPITTGGG